MHFLVPSLTFLTIGGFTLPISGGFNLRKFGGAKLLITQKCAYFVLWSLPTQSSPPASIIIWLYRWWFHKINRSQAYISSSESTICRCKYIVFLWIIKGKVLIICSSDKNILQKFSLVVYNLAYMQLSGISYVRWYIEPRGNRWHQYSAQSIFL